MASVSPTPPAAQPVDFIDDSPSGRPLDSVYFNELGGAVNKHTSQISNAYNDFLHLDGTENMTGKLTAAASSSSRASINIPPGTAPSSPVNGDMWTDSSSVKARIGGSTRTLYHDGNLSTVSQAEAEAGTSTTVRAWTAQRVHQAAQKAVSSGGGGAALSSMTGFIIPANYYFAHGGYFWSDRGRYNISSGAETSFSQVYSGAIIARCGIDNKAYIITVDSGTLRAYSHNGSSQTNLAVHNTGVSYVMGGTGTVGYANGTSAYYADTCGVLNPSNKRIYLWLCQSSTTDNQNLWYYDIGADSFVDTGQSHSGVCSTGGYNSTIASNYGIVEIRSSFAGSGAPSNSRANIYRYNYSTYTQEADARLSASIQAAGELTIPFCAVNNENILYSANSFYGIYNFVTNHDTLITNTIPLNSALGGGDGYIVGSGYAFKIL